MVVFFALIPHSHAKNTVLISINYPVWVQHLSGSLSSCSSECVTLEGQLERLNRELIGNQLTPSPWFVCFVLFFKGVEEQEVPGFQIVSWRVW